MTNIINRLGVLSLIIGVIVLYFNFEKFRIRNDDNANNKPMIRIVSIDLATLILFRKFFKVTCIDLREREFYNYAHIPGSINVPLLDFERVIAKNSIAIDDKINLVFYSGEKSSNSIEYIADYLSKQGAKEIKFYSGGWNEWKSCDMPIESNHNE